MSLYVDMLEWLGARRLLGSHNQRGHAKGTAGHAFWDGYKRALAEMRKYLEQKEDDRGFDAKKKR